MYVIPIVYYMHQDIESKIILTDLTGRGTEISHEYFNLI